MVYWCKQTNDTPEANLSKGKKWSVIYPNIFETYVNFGNKLSKKNSPEYPFNSRKTWLNHLKDNQEDSFPVGTNWFYDKKNKFYGTFIFDDFLFETKKKKEIIESIHYKKNKKYEFFVDFWLSFIKEI
jgi:hypothetical protein